MVQSLNKKVDLTINATSYLGMANYGKVLVGDEAFEYYNDKNVNDYIQIPWSEVTEIMASVMFCSCYEKQRKLYLFDKR